MPKTVYFPEKKGSSGIDITYTKTGRKLSIGGWFDSFVDIGDVSISLVDFCRKLGITPADLKHTIKELEEAK